MKPEKLEQAVITLINNCVGSYTTEQYADFLRDLISSLEMRVPTAREELEND